MTAWVIIQAAFVMLLKLALTIPICFMATETSSSSKNSLKQKICYKA